VSSLDNTIAAHSSAAHAPPRVTYAPISTVGPATFDLQKYLLLIGLHVLLGVLCKQSALIATAYAWSTLLFGLAWLSSQRQPEKFAAVAAYIMGAEVLWRMTKASAPWEFGKYALIVILLLGCQRARPLRMYSTPYWYFLLLVPSCFFTWSDLEFGLARRQLSFNLSGPLSLAISIAFFSRLRVDQATLRAIIRAAILPVFAMSASVVFGIATAKSLHFNTESNAAMSGGFGPNQVSGIFSMGMTLAALAAALLCTKQDRLERILWFACVVLFGTQSALTFSRTGLYLCVLSVAAALLSTAKSARLRNAFILAGVVLYVVAMYVIFPLLNDFTGGALEQRFSSANVTGRDLLMQSDLDVFWSNPLLGVGPGLAVQHRAELFQALAAHSEFTRTLAEHGFLGVCALAVLAVSTGIRILSVRDLRIRGVFIATTAFGMLFLASNAMRIVAPSFLIGLAFAVEKVDARRADRR
jgi:hypothetical protein